MMCWKCGKDAGEGNVECDNCNTTTFTHSDANKVPIDWSKVETLEEAKMIFQEMRLQVQRDTPTYEKLRRFLRE